MYLKKIIVNMIGRENCLKLYDIYKKSFVNGFVLHTKLNVERIKSNDNDVFIGYYDLTPDLSGKLLYHEKRKEEEFVRIMLYEMKLSSSKMIATTNAWNWQQGARLRWIDDHTISFNDYDNERDIYISRFINLENNLERSVDYPFYDIKGQVGASLDFTELGYLRPGYGYVNRPFKKHDDDSDAIVFVNIESGEKIDSIRYNYIAEVTGLNNCEGYYINHISFSPNGERIIFFLLHIENDIHCANLLTNSLISNKLEVVDNVLSSSHYCWVDDRYFITTGYDKNRKCNYYQYDLLSRSRTIFAENVLSEDGHPSHVCNDVFITDTYPDKNGFQRVYIFSPKGKQELLRIFHSYQRCGEQRCDLHPRISEDKSKLIIDSMQNRNREIYLIDIKEKEQWILRLL